MRLIEEKKSLMLQIISLVVVTIASIMGQIANYQIDEFSEKLLHERLKLNEMSEQSKEYKRYFDKYSEWLNLDIKAEVIKELLNDPNVDPNSKVIARKYIDGEIDQKEYFNQMKNHYKNLFLQYRKYIDELTKSFNQKFNSGSKWQPWRDYLFTPLQLIGIFLLIIGHSHLLLSISKRTAQRKTVS